MIKNLSNKIIEIISESNKVKQSLIQKDFLEKVEEGVERVVKTYQNGGKLILFGNGGSAADAQHIATEFMVHYRLKRKSLPAIALTTNTSLITAAANDTDFEYIFSRQVESIAELRDMVIGISTSGNSKNVIKGIESAHKIGAFTMGLIGGDGGKLKDIVDLSLIVPSNSTPRIQESHILIGHIICELTEEFLFAQE